MRGGLEKNPFCSHIITCSHFPRVHPTVLPPSSYPWLSTVRFMQTASQCFNLKHIVIFFYSNKIIRSNLDLKYDENDS